MNRNHSHDKSTLTTRYKNSIKILLRAADNYQNVIDYITGDLGVLVVSDLDLGNQYMFSLAE